MKNQTVADFQPVNGLKTATSSMLSSSSIDESNQKATNEVEIIDFIQQPLPSPDEQKSLPENNANFSELNSNQNKKIIRKKLSFTRIIMNQITRIKNFSLI